MSNPFVVEDIPGRRVPVAEFTNTVRYAGGTGVSGLGAYAPTPYDIVNQNDFQGECPKGYEFEGSFDPSTNSYGFCRKLGVTQALAQGAGLPTWVGPVVGLGVLGVGGFFIFKALRRR